MKWTKLKYLVEQKFSTSLNKRVSINSTRYGNCSCGHAWLTVDSVVVANFCTRAFWNRAQGSFYIRKGRWVTDLSVPEYVNSSQQKKYGEMEYGEFSRQDAYQSCWEFVHNLKIEEAIASQDPLIQSLATLDRRMGKRRLFNMDATSLHPLARKLLSVRLESEGIDS